MASQFAQQKTYCAWALLCDVARRQWQVTLTINYTYLTTAHDEAQTSTVIKTTLLQITLIPRVISSRHAGEEPLYEVTLIPNTPFTRWFVLLW